MYANLTVTVAALGGDGTDTEQHFAWGVDVAYPKAIVKTDLNDTGKSSYAIEGPVVEVDLRTHRLSVGADF